MAEIPDAVLDDAVARYQAGERIADIIEATGVSRSHLYWVLRRRGIKAGRRAPQGEVDVASLLERLAAAEREVGRLQAELAQYKGADRPA